MIQKITILLQFREEIVSIFMVRKLNYKKYILALSFLPNLNNLK